MQQLKHIIFQDLLNEPCKKNQAHFYILSNYLAILVLPNENVDWKKNQNYWHYVNF